MGKMVMADFPLPSWLVILAVLLAAVLIAVLLLAELVMSTSFSEEAVRAGVRAEFNKTGSCLIGLLSPHGDGGGSAPDPYAKLISSYLIRGINTSEMFVRGVRRDGWAYYINTTIRYNDLPLAERSMDVYTSIFGERRIIGPAPDLAGEFGRACAKTCEDNPLVPDRAACRAACDKINATLAQSSCLPG